MTNFDFRNDAEASTIVEAYGASIEGRTVIITGGSEKGMGAASATALARARPKHIILTARPLNESKISPVLDSIREISPATKTNFVGLDTSTFESVRAAAAQIQELVDTVDLLINNAGVIAIPYSVTEDGIEKTFATNYLGHFLLTNLLLGSLLKATPGARVINMASSGHKFSDIKFEDVGFSKGKTYDRWVSYGQSKTALALFSRSLARRYGSRGLLAYSVHPGMISDTPFFSHLTMEDFGGAAEAAAKNGATAPYDPKSVTQGAATILYAALSPDIVQANGAFVQNCKVSPEEEMEYARDMKKAAALWKLSEDLIKQEFPQTIA